MRVLFNTLSIGSFSGRHVVYGFLAQLARWTETEHEFVVLHTESAAVPEAVAVSNVTTLAVPDRLRSWGVRTAWEVTKLPRVLRQQSVDILFNPSGARLPRIPCRQVVLAQNPWCYVRQARRGWAAPLKAALQRRGYRSALRSADLMVFISNHLRTLYRGASGRGPEAPSVIAHVGLDEETFAAAERLRGQIERDPNLIVAVSVMASWKGIETLVSAVQLLRDDGLPARLKLVGPWPDAGYEGQIRRQIEELKLTDAVEVTGPVSRDELWRSYAGARAFSLLSHCESFGIPAAEAQVFGTPVVASTGCAMPEVCGPGGLYGPPDHPRQAAAALRTMLASEPGWQHFSQAAEQNARKLRWNNTARPLMKMFDLDVAFPSRTSSGACPGGQTATTTM